MTLNGGHPGSVLVGTTDRSGVPVSSPSPPEDEIEWLLAEVSRYLSDDLRVRRSDVLSAWQGWRPLASDPHAPPGAPASRDHIVSTNPSTGITFVTGGKWTTYREMAEDAVDRVVELGGDAFGACCCVCFLVFFVASCCAAFPTLTRIALLAFHIPQRTRRRASRPRQNCSARRATTRTFRSSSCRATASLRTRRRTSPRRTAAAPTACAHALRRPARRGRSTGCPSRQDTLT